MHSIAQPVTSLLMLVCVMRYVASTLSIKHVYMAWQIFSGHLPFYDIKNDYRIIQAVALEGRRPPHPSDDCCHIRGLDGEVWDIIQTYWAGEPTEHPSAQNVTELLSLLSTCIDERPMMYLTLHSHRRPCIHKLSIPSQLLQMLPVTKSDGPHPEVQYQMGK